MERWTVRLFKAFPIEDGLKHPSLKVVSCLVFLFKAFPIEDGLKLIHYVLVIFDADQLFKAFPIEDGLKLGHV